MKGDPDKRLIAAIIGGIFLVVASLIGLYGAKYAIDRPIDATVTAEAKLTQPVAETTEPAPTPANTVQQTSPQSQTTTFWVIQTTISQIDGMKMIFVPAGEFIMGSMDGKSNERPIHSVYLDAFWIDSTEVTNAMYAMCVSAGACSKPSDTYLDSSSSRYENSQYTNYPVTYVTWLQAETSCEWAERRLPTEAEWEKAARGPEGNIYPWGNEDPNEELLNYNKNIGNTTQVGSYPDGASFYGALDMAGNVWEYLADLYGEDYYNKSPVINPEGPSSGYNRALRGGSWISNKDFVRSTYRDSSNPDVPNDSRGFRCGL